MIAWVGVATALFAAGAAMAQNDIKKVLAYSTISQLGYMMLAVGTGAYVAAIFHMVTHAFFKALLFLGSGSVIHALDGDQDMRRYGALRAAMPVTSITFIVGWLAIAGVPPFAGFWSKDEILAYAFDAHPALWLVGLVTAVLTAFYMSRLVFMTFYGEARYGDEQRPHEPSPVMTAPLVALAAAAAVAGVMNLPFTKDLHFLGTWLKPSLFGNEAHLAVGGGAQWLLALVADSGGRRRDCRSGRGVPAGPAAGQPPGAARPRPGRSMSTRRSPASWAAPAVGPSIWWRSSIRGSSTERSTGWAGRCGPAVPRCDGCRPGSCGHTRCSLRPERWRCWCGSC